MKTNWLVLKVFAGLFCLLSIKTALAQNVGISSTSSFTPDASAGLDISYTDKGLLIPRVALTATNAASPITFPVTSLLIYNTASAGSSPNNVVPGYYYWSGTAWLLLSTSSPTTSLPWSTTGNTGTNYKTNFLGNIDNAPLRFRTNNIQRVIIDSLGSVGIGSEDFDPTNRDKLLIDAGTTNSSYLISGTGSINSFLQSNIQNSNSGTAASTDIVATADNGTDNMGFIDMGINSSNYATGAGITAKPNTAYIYSTAADLVIGNGAPNKNVVFFTNSGSLGTANTPNGTERMRIDGATGNVGIGTGTTTPAQKLDVTGNIRTTGSITVDATASNTGNLATALLFGSTASGEGISSRRTSGTNQNGLDFYTATTKSMSITNAGNVGIGTANPRYPLEIATKTAYTTGTYNTYDGATDGWNSDNNYSYYAEGTTSSTAGASTGGSGTYYSIVTAGRIAAKEFNAYSDKREKIVIGQSNGKEDLALINKLKITDYTWIDKIGKSPVPEKKLIAQELRAVYPQAVKLIPGFIPNVYQKPVAIKFDPAKKSMLLDFSKAHNSIKGDLLRIYVFDKLYEVAVTAILSSSALTVDLPDNVSGSTTFSKDIFVFGKKVNDYHTVDYDAVAMLNVSATQELYRQLEQQKQENKKAIDDLNKQLKNQNARYQVQQSQIEDLKKAVFLSNSVNKRQ